MHKYAEGSWRATAENIAKNATLDAEDMTKIELVTEVREIALAMVAATDELIERGVQLNTEWTDLFCNFLYRLAVLQGPLDSDAGR